MPSLMEKYGLERAASLAANEAGDDWTILTDAEKQKYYNQVRLRQQKGPDRVPDDNSGLMRPDRSRY